LAQRFWQNETNVYRHSKKRRHDPLIVQQICSSNNPDERSNGRDKRMAAKMPTSPLINRKSEMATAMVSMRSSYRSFSSCWALRNEAGETGIRRSGSGNWVSGLGHPSAGKMQSPVQNLSRLHARERENSHRSALPKRSKRAPHVHAKVADKIDLAVYWLRNLCAFGVRDAIGFCWQSALNACCVAIVLQMGVLK
jgi:hypothetical protein